MFIFNWYAIMTVTQICRQQKGNAYGESKKRKSTKKEKDAEIYRKASSKNVVIVLAVVLVIALGAIGLRSVITSESKTTKIGFENIGELATQSAYCTEVNVTDDWRKLFGIKIPFTQSKYIYSYDFVIKAGYDFKDIKWSEKGDKIEVTLPEVKVLSNEIDLDSFKVYHEEESIFSPITLDESNEALENLKKTAQDDAIANGLFENARSNAETILTGFLEMSMIWINMRLSFRINKKEERQDEEKVIICVRACCGCDCAVLLYIISDSIRLRHV